MSINKLTNPSTHMLVGIWLNMLFVGNVIANLSEQQQLYQDSVAGTINHSLRHSGCSAMCEKW
jgi:hypothetical protein